jgi:hypothetical protein
MKTAIEFTSWTHWAKSPPDPALWTVVDFVQGDDESRSDDWPQKAAVAELLEEEAQARLMAGVWWRPIPW